MNKVRKIGLFAGSFDPVHDGHLFAAAQAQHQLQLDVVYFVVEPRPRYKQGVKAFEHRSEMVRLAVVDNPLFKQIYIDEPYCTVQHTIPMLKQRFPGAEPYLIMGDDVARRIAQWSRVQELFRAVHLVIVRRRQDEDDIVRQIERVASIGAMDARYTFVGDVFSPTSSTAIKQAIKNGLRPDGISPEVFNYIQLHNLYGSSGLGS